MDTLGVLLREEREAKGASLDEAASVTRIRVHLLRALEAGDFATLSGGEVQVRGFLRVYARYLGLFPDDVIERYDLEVHGREPAPEPVPAACSGSPRWRRSSTLATSGHARVTTGCRSLRSDSQRSSSQAGA